MQLASITREVWLWDNLRASACNILRSDSFTLMFISNGGILSFLVCLGFPKEVGGWRGWIMDSQDTSWMASLPIKLTFLKVLQSWNLPLALGSSSTSPFSILIVPIATAPCTLWKYFSLLSYGVTLINKLTANKSPCRICHIVLCFLWKLVQYKSVSTLSDTARNRL